MKITSFIITLVAATALAALGQEGALEDVKHGAKKAGRRSRTDLKRRAKRPRKPRSGPDRQTVGQKTKETAETVGHKTKETAETVGRKTKETAETVGEKTKESAKTVHRKSKQALNKAKAETSGQQSTNQAPNTPSPDRSLKSRLLVNE